MISNIKKSLYITCLENIQFSKFTFYSFWKSICSSDDVITLNLDFDCGFEVTNQQKFSGYLFSKFCGLLAQTYDVKDNEDICLKFTIFYMLVDHSIDNNNASNNNVVDNERTYKKVSGNL